MSKNSSKKDIAKKLFVTAKLATQHGISRSTAELSSVGKFALGFNNIGKTLYSVSISLLMDAMLVSIAGAINSKYDQNKHSDEVLNGEALDKVSSAISSPTITERYKAFRKKYYIINKALTADVSEMSTLVELDPTALSPNDVVRRKQLLEIAPNLCEYLDTMHALSDAVRGSFLAQCYRSGELLGNLIKGASFIPSKEQVGSLFPGNLIATSYTTITSTTSFVSSIPKTVLGAINSGFCEALLYESYNSRYKSVLDPSTLDQITEQAQQQGYTSALLTDIIMEYEIAHQVLQQLDNRTHDQSFLEAISTTPIYKLNIADFVLKKLTDYQNQDTTNSIRAGGTASKIPIIKMIHDLSYFITHKTMKLSSLVLGIIQESMETTPDLFIEGINRPIFFNIIPEHIELYDQHLQTLSNNDDATTLAEFVRNKIIEEGYNQLPEENRPTLEEYSLEVSQTFKVTMQATVEDLVEYAELRRNGVEEAQISFVEYFKKKAVAAGIEEECIFIDFSSTKNKDGKYIGNVLLEEINLSNADLSGINFEGASFYGTNLTGTIFNNCNIKGVDFRYSEGLDIASTKGVTYDEQTLVKAGWVGNYNYQQFIHKYHPAKQNSLLSSTIVLQSNSETFHAHRTPTQSIERGNS